MLIGSISAQTTTAFRMNYDVALMDIPAHAIESQTAGNYIFAGTNVNFLPIVGTVTELSSSGSVVWSKSYSGGLSYQLNDIKKDGASGYYMCGGSSSSSGIFLRVNNTGAYVDGNRFDLTNATGEYLSRVIKTSDGGYVAAGYSYGYDPDGAGALPKNDSTTALVVKFDANGNHLWHHVFRFYSDAGKTNPILNDGSFVDVVEVSDGYIFVGSYEVDDVINVNSDGDDMTPNDAMILKTTTAGAITYLKQIDVPSTTSSNPSRDFTSISKTAAGLPLISGSDGTGRPLLVMRLAGSGGWAVPTWIRKYGATQFFGTYDPFIPSRFFETNDGQYAIMGMYIIPLSFDFSQFTMKIDPATYTPAWTKKYNFSMAVILPQGGQVSDNGYLSLSTVMNGTGFDYHVIKTDPNGVAPGACAETTVSPSNATVSYTWADPYYNDYNANTFDNSAITPTITTITPAATIQCQTIVAPCTPPSAATTVTATPATICAGQSTSITASGPSSNVTYNVYTASTGGTNLGATPLSVTPGTTTTYYVETVDNTNPTCVSTTRTAVTVTVNPAPTAPIIGTITQPTCTVSTGSVALSGLPSSGTWTVTASPGGATITGTGTTGTFTGLAPGTYTFTVASAGGTTTVFTENYDGNGGAGSNWGVLNSTIGAQGDQPNIFYVSDQESGEAAGACGTSGTGDNSLHIGSTTAGDLGAAYDAGGVCGFLWCTNTNRRSYSNNINTTGLSGMSINFNYIENGEGSQDNAIAEYSIDGGATWLTLFDLAKTTLGACAPQGTWTAYSTTLPATCNNITNLRIGFRWLNDDDGIGTDPSFAVDDITISVAGSGCSSLASASAIINAAPTTPTAPVVGTITQPTCSIATGSVALSGLPASGTWTVTASPGALTTTGTGTTTTFSGLTAGATYTFTVTNSGGCTSTASTSAVLNTAPTAATAPVIGAITQATCSVSTGSVALSGLPSSGSWTITTTPGGTTTTGSGSTTTLTGLTAGTTYTFTVTNASGCTSPSSANAVLNAAPTIPTAPVIGSITQPTCTVSTGSVDLSGLPASGTWTVTAAPGGTTTTGTGTTTTFSGLTAGTTYTFTVTNSDGCSSSASANAILNAAPSSASTPVIGTITQPTCTVSTGSVALSGLPASGTWTVTISPGATTSTGTGTATTITGLTAGTTYTFTVTNASGCTSAASANAVINAAPAVPTAPIVGTITQPTCSVSTGTVDLSGLPASGTWTITALPGSFTTTGTGTTSSFTGLTAGTTYTFTITNAAGCTSTASTNAIIGTAPGAPSAPVIGTITQPTCSVSTGSVALSGLPSSGTWTLTTTPGGATSTGTGTTTTITGLTAGTTYTFIVTNAAGCSSTTSANAAINSAPTTPTAPIIGTITQPTCSVATGSVDLSGLPASGTWTVTTSPGGSTSTGTGTTTTLTGLTAGTTYTFTLTNSAGCTSTASTNAVINTAPTAPTTPVIGSISQPTCSVATGAVDLSGLPSSGTWTVTANPGALTATGTGTTTTFTGLTAGTTYTFTVTNAAGCTSAASVNAVIGAQPSTPTSPIVGSITQPTCSNTTGSVDLSGLPASGTWTVTSTPGGATATGTGTTTTISGLIAGTTYSFTVTNSVGCTSTVSTNAVINVLPAAPSDPTASVTTQPTCAIPTGTITITAPTGSNFEYSIDGSTYQTGTTFTGLTPGNYSVTVQDLSTGCVSTGVVTLTVNSVAGAPVITILTEVDVTCFGDTDGSASIQVSGGSSPYTYTWSPSGGSGDVASGLAAGSYTVTVTDNIGCSSVETIVIGTPGLLVVGGVETNVSCTSSTAGSIATNVTGGSGSYTYLWTPDGETSTSLTGLSAGSYGITVTDANGCTANESYTIVTNGSLLVSVTPIYSEIDAGESVELTATGGTNYSWTPSIGLSCDTCNVTTASPTTTTTYIVTVSDDNGCFGQDTAIVKVNIMCGEFFVPNIFSPNGTGPSENNHLCVYGTPACIAELNFAIYNRWGEKVFETTDITQCWNGMYKEKMMNSGIFVYKLNATLIDGTEIEQSGNITLVH